MAAPHVLTLANHLDRAMLEIVWSDGAYRHLSHPYLRAHCRCADCLSRQRVGLAPITHSDVRLIDIKPTGGYGIQLIFDDGHDRGIYPWSYLYGLEQAQA